MPLLDTRSAASRHAIRHFVTSEQPPSLLRADSQTSPSRVTVFSEQTPRLLRADSKTSPSRLPVFSEQTPRLLRADSKTSPSRPLDFSEQTPRLLRADSKTSPSRCRRHQTVVASHFMAGYYCLMPTASAAQNLRNLNREPTLKSPSMKKERKNSAQPLPSLQGAILSLSGHDLVLKRTKSSSQGWGLYLFRPQTVTDPTPPYGHPSPCREGSGLTPSFATAPDFLKWTQ